MVPSKNLLSLMKKEKKKRKTYISILGQLEARGKGSDALKFPVVQQTQGWECEKANCILIISVFCISSLVPAAQVHTFLSASQML